MSVSTSHDPCLDTLRLTDQQARALMERLNEESHDEASDQKRAADRKPLAFTGAVILRIYSKGGGVLRYLVRPRNISSHGIGFLHGNYIHSETRCQIVLMSPDRKTQVAPGRIVRCRHIANHVHEVGVAFEHPIDASRFCVDQVDEDEPEVGQAEAPMDVPAGKILYIEDSVDDQQLMKFHLTNLGLQIKIARDGRVAMLQASKEKFDAVITDLMLPGMSGEQIATMLRDNQYAGPILALSAGDSKQICDSALAAGCTSVLAKPLNVQQLHEWLGEHLLNGKSEGDDDILFSAHWALPAMRSLIMQFLGRLNGLVTELARMVESGQSDAEIQHRCLDLKGTAGGYGYASISRLAAELFDLSASGAEVEQMKIKVDELQQQCAAACRAVRPPSDA